MHKTSRLVIWGLSLIFLLLTAGVVYADSGLYAGASLGRTMIDDDLGGLPIDDEATAFSAKVGVDFGNNIALEGGYLNLGEVSVNTLAGIIDGEVDGGTVAAVFSLPVSDNLSLTAKAGMFFWQSELRSPNFTFAEDGEDLFYGIGLRADLNEQLSITGEWDRIKFDEADANLLFVGVGFRF